MQMSSPPPFSGSLAERPILSLQEERQLRSRNEKLLKACKDNDLEKVKHLIAHTDPTHADSLCFRTACEHGFEDIARVLLPHSDGRALRCDALSRASMNGHVNVVKFLIPLSDPTLYRFEACRKAIQNGHHEVIDLFLPFVITMRNQEACIAEACMVQNKSLVEKLLSSGVKLDRYHRFFAHSAVNGWNEWADMAEPFVKWNDKGEVDHILSLFCERNDAQNAEKYFPKISAHINFETLLEWAVHYRSLEFFKTCISFINRNLVKDPSFFHVALDEKLDEFILPSLSVVNADEMIYNMEVNGVPEGADYLRILMEKAELIKSSSHDIPQVNQKIGRRL